MKNLEDIYTSNKKAWNLRTSVHFDSEWYKFEAWRAGETSLQEIELRELGDVKGKSLLHLQCHFGQDTLSWAREGAEVTGVDISDAAIVAAEGLAKEEGIDAAFVCCNVYDLAQHLDNQQFDIVFTSYGTVGWLEDLEAWAALIYRYLKPGGTFYIADFHPVVWMFDDEFTFIQYPYHKTEVIKTENEGTYSDRNAPIKYTDYSWNHSLSEIINSLTGQGLHIEFLNEYPYSPYDCFSKTVKGTDGNYRIKGLENKIPMVFSIMARKA